ncbi:hypothetical protein NC652_004748 [Populus alba x Populus x berolinensis]|uniref:Uncharacterized protein n=1 Tax=Populus alba x Populus x berolinensis TaxID=444605 RepID=A0AAD6RU95_9ROSI|nr:hypothetical protein NC652_004558 [Populus alba x Populus x berolinensis]KAJ6967286.1 hypothetical protein NC652_004748 [Populus alba x Populus x berolinensis]KAJ7015244.1 hypothetical protein NC653_004525 [Populus alba x Populus x berolinensis]KAJ7015245.1 hypothetical protein NC653_004525 [Populus alba x Populus x berolinensis]
MLPGQFNFLACRLCKGPSLLFFSRYVQTARRQLSLLSVARAVHAWIPSPSDPLHLVLNWRFQAPAVEDEDGFRDAAELPVWQTVGEEGGRNRICFKSLDLVNRAFKMQMPLADTS